MRPRPTPAARAAVDVEGWTWGGLVRLLLLHARSLGATVEEAEDLVQEAVEATVRDPSWYDPDRGPLIGLLKVVLRHRLFDRHRARDVRDRALPHLVLVATEPSPVEEVLWRSAASERRALLLAHLSQAERDVLRAWLRQRHGELDVHAAASTIGQTGPAFEASKKRLRRRCLEVAASLGFGLDDLIGGDAT